MVKKSRKSDDRVYGVLTSEYFAYGKEEFHVTGPSTMEIRRVVPLAMAVVTWVILNDCRDFYLTEVLCDCHRDNTSSSKPSPHRAVDVVELTEDEILKGKQADATVVEEQEDITAQLFVLTKDKSFALQFPTREERTLWFEDLSAACR